MKKVLIMSLIALVVAPPLAQAKRVCYGENGGVCKCKNFLSNKCDTATFKAGSLDGAAPSVEPAAADTETKPRTVRPKKRIKF